MRGIPNLEACAWLKRHGGGSSGELQGSVGGRSCDEVQRAWPRGGGVACQGDDDVEPLVDHIIAPTWPAPHFASALPHNAFETSLLTHLPGGMASLNMATLTSSIRHSRTCVDLCEYFLSYAPRALLPRQQLPHTPFNPQCSGKRPHVRASPVVAKEKLEHEAQTPWPIKQILWTSAVILVLMHQGETSPEAALQGHESTQLNADLPAASSTNEQPTDISSCITLTYSSSSADHQLSTFGRSPGI